MTSLLRPLAVSTTRCTKSFLIVGPTCKSVIWVRLKPLSSGGRPGIFISTSTTWGVRRALKNQIIVAMRLLQIIKNPQQRWNIEQQPGAKSDQKSVTQKPNNITSRSKVKTNNQEKRPNSVNAIHETRSLNGVVRSCRIKKPAVMLTYIKSRPTKQEVFQI